MKRISSIALALLVLVSCKTNESFDDEVLVFEPKSNCSIVDDCVSKVEIQPLQAGESLIGAVKLCKETALGLVLVDYNYNVFLFNAAGELQNAISRVGRGPQEYVAIDDLDVDRQGNLYILSMGTDVLVYSASGDFVGRHTLPAPASSLAVLDDNQLCFSLLHEEDAAYGDDRLLFTDAEISPLRSALPLWETTVSAFGFAFEKLFKRSGAASCLYYQSHDKHQYSIDHQGNVVKTYTLDFGDYAVTDEFLQSRSQEEMVNYVMHHDFYYVCNVFESRNYLLFNVIFQQKAEVPAVAVWIYDKRCRKSSIEHYPNEDSPLFRLLQFPVCMTNDDVVWYVCDNESLREYKETFGFLQSVEIPLSEGMSLLKFHF